MLQVIVTTIAFAAVASQKTTSRSHIVHVDDFYVWELDQYSYKSDNIEAKYTELFLTDKLFSKSNPLFPVQSPDSTFTHLSLAYDNYRFIAFYSATFIVFYRLDVLLMSLKKLNIVYIKNIAKGEYAKYQIQNLISFAPDLMVAELFQDQSRVILSMQLSYDIADSEIDIKDQISVLASFKERVECQAVFKRFTKKLLRYCSNIGNAKIFEYDLETAKLTQFPQLSFDSTPTGIDYKSHEIVIAIYSDAIITYEIPTSQTTRVSISPITHSFFETTTNELFFIGVDKVLYSFDTRPIPLYDIPFEITECRYMGWLISSGFFYCEMPNKSVVVYDVKRPNFVLVDPQTFTFISLDFIYRGSPTILVLYKDAKTYYFEKFEMSPTRYALTFNGHGKPCNYYMINCWIGTINNTGLTMEFVIYTGERQRDILVHLYEEPKFHWEFGTDKNLLYLSNYFQGFIDEISIFDNNNELETAETITGNFYEVKKFKYENFVFDAPPDRVLKEKVFLNDNYVINGAIVTDFFNQNSIILSFVSREDQVLIATYTAKIQGKIDKILKFQLSKTNTFWVFYTRNKKYALCLLNVQLSNTCVDKNIFTDSVFEKNLNLVDSISYDGSLNIFFTLKIKGELHQLIRLTSSNMNDFVLSKQEIMLSDSITNLEIMTMKDQMLLYVTSTVDHITYLSVISYANNIYDTICTFPTSGNQFFFANSNIIVLNSLSVSMTFVSVVDKRQVTRQIYSPMKFYPIKDSQASVQVVSDFIAVLLRGDDLDYYGSIDISGENPYVGFRYLPLINKTIASRYICDEHSCYYAILTNSKTLRTLFIIRKSFFLHYQLTVESSNYVIQEMDSSNILFSFFFKINTYRDIKFIEKVNVEISDDYIINRDAAETFFELDSNTSAEMHLPDMFSGNIMGYHIDFGSNNVMPVKNSGSKFILGPLATLNTIRFFEPIVSPTETHYFKSKDWVINYEIDESKFLSLQFTGVITYFIIGESRYDILAKITVSAKQQFDFTFCVSMSYFGTQILLSCQDLFYYIDVPEDLTKLTTYKEFQCNLEQILYSAKPEFIPTAEENANEIGLKLTDGRLNNTLTNSPSSSGNNGSQQKIDLRHENRLQGLANLGLSIKNSIIFDDNILMLYKDETLTILSFNQNKFSTMLKYDVPCKVCKFINLKCFATTDTRIILVTFDAMIYMVALQNNRISSNAAITLQYKLEYLFINKFEQLQLIAIGNRQASIVDVRMSSGKLTYAFQLQTSFNMLSDYQILDAMFLQSTFIFMTVESAKQRLYLSAHTSKGTLKSAIEYEGLNLGNYSILAFENNRLYLASQFNFISIIKINWDFALYFFPEPQNMQEMSFDIIAYNPFYALKTKTRIIFSARTNLSVFIAWLYQYYSLEIAMTLSTVTIIGYYLSR
jgi:hypothetical protein